MSSVSDRRPEALAQRVPTPDHLFMLNAADTIDTGDTFDIFSRRAFSWSDINRTNITAHLSHSSAPSPFLTAYAGEKEALKSPTSATRKVILKLTAHSLVPAIAFTTTNQEIPVWIEQGPLPNLPRGVFTLSTKGFEAFESSMWVCLDEVRDLIGLEAHKGVWLACGGVPGRMICRTNDGVTNIHETSISEKRSVKQYITEIEARKKMRSQANEEKDSQRQAQLSVPLRTNSQCHVRIAYEDEDSHLLAYYEDLQPHVSPVLTRKPRRSYSPSIWEELASQYASSQAPKATPTIVITPDSSDKAPHTPTTSDSSNDPQDPPLITTSPGSTNLIYPPIPPTTPLSKRTAATLAKLEDVHLNMLAWKMWRDEVLERNSAT